MISLRTYLQAFVDGKSNDEEDPIGPLLLTGSSDASTGINEETLELAMGNVLNNAARYRQPGSPIVFRLEEERDWAVFYIENTGPAIPPEKLEQIFDLGHSTGHGVHNKGIGLYMSRHYLRMMGGELKAVPRFDGAAFRFQLPLR